MGCVLRISADARPLTRPGFTFIMKFNDITSRLTGISCPIFGVSWTPPASERDTAKGVVAFLEDRRVLYNASELEVPEHCVHSVIEIRHRQIEMGPIEMGPHLSSSLVDCHSARLEGCSGVALASRDAFFTFFSSGSASDRCIRRSSGDRERAPGGPRASARDAGQC